MIIISHRGYWEDPGEKNTIEAFRRSFKIGLGVETDVRGFDGTVVISHDPPKAGALTLRDFLELHGEYGGAMPLALNVKSDGLQAGIKDLLDQFNVSNYFVFDMSIPDLISYRDSRIPFFIRMSEYEKDLVFLEDACGVWLDGFNADWFSEGEIEMIISRGKQVCVVSPELHGRDHLSLWKRLKRVDLESDGRLILCTDFVADAYAYFR
jgi:glycerophosphoryl diester phosphodiesterase